MADLHIAGYKEWVVSCVHTRRGLCECRSPIAFKVRGLECVQTIWRAGQVGLISGVPGSTIAVVGGCGVIEHRAVSLKTEGRLVRRPQIGQDFARQGFAIRVERRGVEPNFVAVVTVQATTRLIGET